MPDRRALPAHGRTRQRHRKENYWIRTDTGESGNAVDFFVKIRGMSFIETMRLLLG